MKKKRVKEKGYSQRIRKFILNTENGSEILFSIGVGSFLAFYLIELFKTKLIPLTSEIEQMIATGNIQNIHIGLWESIIFMVGFIAILIAPLLSQWNNKVGTKVYVLSVMVLANVGGGITAIVQGKVFSLFILLIWISSVYITWFCIGILKIIYSWLRVGKEEKEQFNIVKLTFIWAIIAFVLGKIMR